MTAYSERFPANSGKPIKKSRSCQLKSIEENAVEVLTVATEEVATIKKRKLKMKYEHIEAEFETYTDIDTYLRLENQYHQHITNNNNTKCTLKCTHADQHDNHIKSIYMKCCCKLVAH